MDWVMLLSDTGHLSKCCSSTDFFTNKIVVQALKKDLVSLVEDRDAENS